VGPLGQRHILVDELHRLTMPTLVVWGARDAVVPVRHARAAAGRLPQGELVVIPDAGHAPHVERPREFIAALQAFLRERPGRTAARRAVP
jgi:pimeloyl-ACP methyl ester carboxylesterase